ncbi:MAG: acyl-CoA dehydratase activase [Elusimicrobiota bacterium]
MRRIGIDIGSLYLGCAVLEAGRVLHTHHREHKGDIAGAIAEAIGKPGSDRYDRIGVCGSLKDTGQAVLDATLATIEGVRFLLPGCRNLFSIGGETFSIIVLDEGGEYREHSVNSPCASGTGSFIEQQAERLEISAAELARRAAAFRGKTPVIATRCAVFAKTDIIHAMQEGYSLDAICAGLCEGIARNVLDALVKGREMTEPVAVVGGVSLNPKIVGTIESTLGKRVVVPEHAHVAGAVGAALLAEEPSFDFDALTKRVRARRSVRPRLEMRLTKYPDFREFSIFPEGDVEVFLPKKRASLGEGVYLGIDIGSTSTKTLVMSAGGEIAGGFYTATRGEPFAAVQRLIGAMDSVFERRRPALRGVGTTGSGRKMIHELFGADMEVNEITAHAKAATFLTPEADTIVEIGGQDSKFTRIRDGDVYYSAMNYVCAAGTGSFIEEQAKRLGVSLKDFSDMALSAEAPFTSDRCTVYMERDLNVLMREGWSKRALAAAVLNSVRDNYVAKVVGHSPIGEHVVFQGATARNAALVASFEQLLDRPIHVSPYCHLTGALGMALLCREAGLTRSRFVWDVRDVRTEEEICERCANHCLLTVVAKESVKTGWGMKCGREYSDRRPKKVERSAPAKRYIEALRPPFRTPGPDRRPPGAAPMPEGARKSRADVAIGLPHGLYNVEYSPLWHDFLSRLGFKVITSTPSRKALAEGKKAVNSDFCAPMVAAHGYVKQLLDRGAQHIFYPAIVNEHDREREGAASFKKKTRDAYFCYYSQYLPSILSKLTSMDLEDKILSPLILFNENDLDEIARELHQELARRFPDLGLEEVGRAFHAAYEDFLAARRNLKATHAALEAGRRRPGGPRIVLMGRPYVAFDPIMNLGLPRKLEELGAELFWQDELDLEGFQPVYANKFYERMHWHYGKTIVKVAEYCAESDDLFVVYLSCFRCSPDSFLISYVKDIMTHYGKPFLVLQLDEHSSDVGYTTRIEAAMRSFENHLGRRKPAEPVRPTRARDDRLEKGDTVLVLHLDDLISRLWADCFRRAGYRALTLDADEKSLSTGYKYASGGECMPLVSIAGSVIEKVRSEGLDPRKTFFYMPTVCVACNLPQYPIFSDMAFEAAGLKGLKIGLINSMAPGEILPHPVAVRMFESFMVSCIIYKMYNRIKPYERDKGATDRVSQEAKETLSEAILSGKDLRAALAAVADMFRSVPRDESGGRKPRIALIGDLYVKYSSVVNQRLQSLVEDLGGELAVSSMTEYPFQFYDADIRLHGHDPRHYRTLRKIEHRFERIAADIIGDQLEPDFADCMRLMEDYKIRHYIAGETSINIGRALYYIKQGGVDAIVHINPMFCCPGVVSASIFRKMQEDFGIPIIDIFYDGTGDPNGVLIPHLHYLKRKGVRC